MEKRRFYFLLVTGLVILGILMASKIKAAEINSVRIKIKAEGEVVHYQKESIFDKTEFSRILKNKAEFKSKQIAEFNRCLSRYSLHATNYQMEFDPPKKSIILKCDVHGAVSKRGNSYYGRFGWLLNPLGLDFIDDHFKKSKTGLSWKGTVKGIPTDVICEFPVQKTVYKDWGSSIGHCHAHVWWTIR